MRTGLCILSALLVLFLVLWLPSHTPPVRGHTWLELTDAGTGREIAAHALREGERVVLTWKNSLFGLLVTEVFVARAGHLDLTEVTFADPEGGAPPSVGPEGLDDLYHTGGPFRATGFARPFSRILFRVGEIGHPRLSIGEETIDLLQQVNFGGAVLLVTRKPTLRGIRSLREGWAFFLDMNPLRWCGVPWISRRLDQGRDPGNT